jgi:hypothetical protein
MKFKKEKVKIWAYWVFTVWGLGFLGISGLCQLAEYEQAMMTFSHLGYPAYFAKITGIWKVAAAVVALIPGCLLLKEWAYAGLFFLLTGAMASHIFAGDPFFGQPFAIFPALFSLILVSISWVLRPDNRRLPGTKPWKRK